MVNSYYDLTVRLRYYGRLPKSTRHDGYYVFGELGSEMADVTRWKETPHEYLANVRRIAESNLCDPKAVEMFVNRYGLLDARLDRWSPSSSSKFEEGCVTFSSCQETLCKAWRRNVEALSEVAAQVEHALDVTASMNAGTIELTTENLWCFICVLFMRDFQAGKAKICASPDCVHPYFLEQRKGQKYCLHLCAVRENVRRFRATEAQTKQQKIIRKRGRRLEHGARKTR
jgi:hypothetical protein